MERVTIQVETINAAFTDDPSELARILRELAEKIENGEQPAFVRDINGNKVGTIDWE